MADRLVRDVMTRDVAFLPADTTLDEAARIMRTRNIGDIVVTEGQELSGLVTDRDIVLRAVADSRDPVGTSLREVVSRDLVAIRDSEPVDRVGALMRERAVRRVLVYDEENALVGIVSLGDVARSLEPESILARISDAPPNH
ncbi:MAG TPA: CBS domain-containing protein [Micromonosporaceae bacterium]